MLNFFKFDDQVVQMYQWYEMQDNMSPDGPGEHDGHAGGHNTYSYDADWFDHRIQSESFENSMGHHNPEEWPYNSSV
jgi:hypothetical protein